MWIFFFQSAKSRGKKKFENKSDEWNWTKIPFLDFDRPSPHKQNNRQNSGTMVPLFKMFYIQY